MEQELKTKFDKWLYTFRHLSNLKDRPEALEEEVFEEFFKSAEIAQFSSKERQYYEQSLKRYRDWKNTLDYSKEQGLEEGRKQGIEEGKKQGIEEGKKQGLTAIAKKMKEAGLAIEDIQLYTGLSIEEIKAL
jgi:predicted transposase/invertase (TIGR01784 family)